KLFIGYNQAAAADNRHIEGAGFSLPLTKTIVEMMDGTISVQSEYGKGSTFTVRIRQKYLVDATIGPVVAERLRNFKYGATKHLENMNLKRIRLPYAKILIVDDLRVNLEIAAGIMKPYGMQIDCVTSGAEAIEAIRQEKVKYSAIFMDHMMPGMDGIEATRIIREEIGSEYAKKVPIIVLTANAVTGNEEMFLSHGFQAFLAKPIDTKRLDAVIQKWVRDKSIEKSLVEQYIMVNGEMMLEMRSGRNRRVLPTRRSGIERRKEQENGKPQNKTAFSDSLFAKWQINGLKLAEALNSFGDEKILLHVLQIFAADSPAQLEQIRQISMEDIQNYRIIVHGFKGSLRAIYGETLAKQAGKLEQAAKDNNYDYIKAHNETFIKNMEALLNSLREMLYNTATQKPKKPAPDTQVLADLLAASKCYDIDGVDLALGELQKYEYDSDEELIIWLGETIKNMGFKEITQRLTQILA
ncbi:MAG: response regulator, partial [Firmicutes bacterium]|nr:response regulator [Bacillota bacterium]